MTIKVSNNKTSQIVREIADRMREPDRVEQILFHPHNQNFDSFLPHYPTRFRLTSEYAGLVLLFAELDRLFPHENWEISAHAYILKIKQDLETTGMPSLALFGGVAEICFALQQASGEEETRYQKMRSTLNQYLFAHINKEYFAPLQKNLQLGQASHLALYDLIQGLVGIGIYCLNNLSLAPFSDITQEIIKYLIQLTQPLEVENRKVPGWYQPVYYLHEGFQKQFPQCNFNLGLAHGMPGILAFLAKALLKGIEVESQKATLEKLVIWLQERRKEYKDSFFWNKCTSFEEEIAPIKVKQNTFSSRDAWCYGTPGVARSLFIAGKALKNEKLKHYALESFCSIFRRSRQEWNLPGPTFCHGISGLSMMTYQMAKDSQSPFLIEKVDTLKNDLLQYYQAEYPFGFKNYEPCQMGGYAKLDQVSLLEGSAGILLTLLSLEHPTSEWYAPLLI